jgi:hypothetical protein
MGVMSGLPPKSSKDRPSEEDLGSEDGWKGIFVILWCDDFNVEYSFSKQPYIHSEAGDFLFGSIPKRFAGLYENHDTLGEELKV